MKSFLKSQRKKRQSQNYHLKVRLKANGNYRNGSKNILNVGKNRGTQLGKGSRAFCYPTASLVVVRQTRRHGFQIIEIHLLSG